MPKTNKKQSSKPVALAVEPKVEDKVESPVDLEDMTEEQLREQFPEYYNDTQDLPTFQNINQIDVSALNAVSKTKKSKKSKENRGIEIDKDMYVALAPKGELLFKTKGAKGSEPKRVIGAYIDNKIQVFHWTSNTSPARLKTVLVNNILKAKNRGIEIDIKTAFVLIPTRITQVIRGIHHDIPMPSTSERIDQIEEKLKRNRLSPEKREELEDELEQLQALLEVEVPPRESVIPE